MRCASVRALVLLGLATEILRGQVAGSPAGAVDEIFGEDALRADPSHPAGVLKIVSCDGCPEGGQDFELQQITQGTNGIGIGNLNLGLRELVFLRYAEMLTSDMLVPFSGWKSCSLIFRRLFWNRLKVYYLRCSRRFCNTS